MLTVLLFTRTQLFGLTLQSIELMSKDVHLERGGQFLGRNGSFTILIYGLR